MTDDVVIIADHGGANPRRVPVAGVQAGTELSNVGSFSCFASIADLRAAGLAGDLSGAWLWWRGERAGPWGGVITGRPESDGVAELVAEGWATLLRGRVLDGGEWAGPGQPGGIAKRILIGAGREFPTFLTLGAIDESGEPLQIELADRDAVEDLLPALADDGGLEWMVDAERVLHAGRRLGRDLSATRRLVEGRHVVDYRTPDTHWAKRPAEVLGVPTVGATLDRDMEQIAAGTGALTGAARRRRRRGRRRGGDRGRWQPGRRIVTVESDELDIFSGPAGAARDPASSQPIGIGANDLAAAAPLFAAPDTTPIELTLADVDGCWDWCQLGNTVSLLLGIAGFGGRFRVMARGIDTVAGTLTVAGEAQSDDWGVG